jgi:hypothetical protein
MVEESPKNGNRSPRASQSDTQFNTKKHHLKVEGVGGKAVLKMEFQNLAEITEKYVRVVLQRKLDYRLASTYF